MNKQCFAGLLPTDLTKIHAYDFNIRSLELIHSYIYDRIQRVKINSSFSHWSNVKSGIAQGPIKWLLLCDLLFDIIEIDIANYAVDTTSDAPDSKL